MRIPACIIMLFAFEVTASAQERTLIGGDIESSGFGGPVVRYTRINDQGAFLVGGRGGWIINNVLVLGGGGYGVFTEVDAPEGALDIEFGYGGFEMEYIVHPSSLGHFTGYTLVGGGTTNFVKDVGEVTDSNEQVGESDFAFVVEPAVAFELNVTTWFRLNAGVSYRLVNGIDQPGLKDDDFSGPAAILTFKFGNF